MIMLYVGGVAFLLLALAWLVYPALMWAAARRPIASVAPAAAGQTESVAVVVATRDDPDVVSARVDDLLAADYPRDKLQVVIAVDPGAVAPLAQYADRLAGRARVVAGDAPGGKATTLNAGVRGAAGADIIVFADAGQRFDPSAIRCMAEFLRDSRFGGVTGRYTQERNDALMVAYAEMEAMVRAGQSARHSIVSTSGSIYAMRPGLWQPLPAGLICDDLFTTMSIVRQGRRVGFSADAIAFDPRSFTREQQFVRRVRTLTGLIQYCSLRPAVLLPWTNPIWPHFVLHKLLRLATPLLLAIGVFAIGVFAALRAPGLLLTVIVVGAGVAAVIALAVRLLMPARFARLAGQVRWIVRLQLIPALALSNGLRRRWAVWTPADTASSDAAARDPLERTR